MLEGSNCPAGDIVGKEKPLLSAHINSLRIILTGRMGKRIGFTDEEIEKMIEMYQQGCPSSEIAEGFEVSKNTVIKRLKENSCKIKSPAHLRDVKGKAHPRYIEFTGEQLEEMVRKYEDGISSTELAKEFEVSRETILRRLREKGCEIRPSMSKREKSWKYVERNIPIPWEDIDASYVFGVLIGDAFMAGEKDSPEGIILNTPDNEFITVLSKAIGSAFGIQPNQKPRPRKGNMKNQTQLAAYSVDLGKAYDKFKWRKEIWRVPEKFFNASRKIRIALCQGKFDSDGTVDKKAIVISSIYKPGLKDMQKIVENLNFETTFNGPYTPKHPNRKDYWKLRILIASSKLFRLPRKKKVLQRVNS